MACHLEGIAGWQFGRRGERYIATRIGKIYHYGVPLNIGTSGHDDPHSWDYTINPRGRDRDDEAKVVTLRPGQYGGTLSWLAAITRLRNSS